MGQYFEKMFFWDEFLCYYSEDEINYIGNSSLEKRSNNTDKINQLNKKITKTKKNKKKMNRRSDFPFSYFFILNV